MKIVKEEIFGPVSLVITFEDDEDILRQANDAVYGLPAVFSKIITRAIETAHKPSTSPRQPPPNERRRPLYTNSKPPNTKPTSILPTVSIPHRPSEIETRETSPSRPLEDHQPKQMRGLDAYERALWNWVNVYNLDAFLQEVYYYYEGKGIYSIALSRGLNLVLVIIVNLSYLV